MRIGEIVTLMERYLPCPPDPMPEPGSDADYLWHATAFNASRERPLPYVDLVPPQPPHDYFKPVAVDATVRIVRVECDSRGRGIRVIR